MLLREKDRLIVEAVERPLGLLETLATLTTLDEVFPDVDEGQLPLDTP